MLSTSGKSSEQLQQIISVKAQVPVETWMTAQTWLDQLDQVIDAHQMVWLKPLVNVSPHNEIVLEWWHNSKKLTVYIDSNNAEYIQVWGSDIDHEMTDGIVNDFSTIETLWHWLVL
jgi:hypothetical protein